MDLMDLMDYKDLKNKEDNASDWQNSQQRGIRGGFCREFFGLEAFGGILCRL